MLARPARGHCPTNHPFVGNIEERTKRFVTIEHERTPSNLSKCHSQWQSSFFSSLPIEIREMIYDYASKPNVDPSDLKTGPQCLTYLRMPVVWRVNLSWLRSCRRIWLEANSFVWQNAEPTFYRHSDKPDLHGFLYQLTSVNVQNLKRLHIGQECHNLRVNDAMMRLLEGTKLQPWPPHLTVTLIAYPGLWEQDAIKDWFDKLLNHRKLQTVHEIEFVFHIPETQAGNVVTNLDLLGSDPKLCDWRLKLHDREGQKWMREWGDVKLQNHWANKVDMPYRTFKVLAQRLNSHERPQTYKHDLAWDCWHLVPYRIMFARRDSMEPDSGCADRLVETWGKRWSEENSLLRFAE